MVKNTMKRTSVLLLSALLAWSILVALVPVKVAAQPVIEVYELEASEDTYIDERGAYRDTNFGTSPYLLIGSSPEGNQRILVKFDLSELPYGSIRSAKLILNATKVPLGERTYEAYVASGPWENPSWTEYNVTWNNQPWWWDLMDTATVGGLSATPGLIEWDVKEAVKMWINRWWPNHGLYIRDRNEWSPAKFQTTFDSRESSGVRPKLRIEIVISPTFELSVYPSRMSSAPGGSTQWWMHIRSVNGWYGTINLTASSLEAFGGSVEFEKSTVNLNPYADIGMTMTLTAGIARKGSYTFTINATSGVEFSDDTGIIDIVPAPAIRTLPDSVTPNMPYSVGTPIRVNMTYNPGSIEGFQDGNPVGIIVKERLQWYQIFVEDPLNPYQPATVWTDNKGDADPFNDETYVTWIFAQGFEGVDLTTGFTWSYKVNFTVPDGVDPGRVPTELWWWGEWKAIDSQGMSMQGTVLGDERVKLEFGLPGYWDDDGRVDDWDILQVIASWRQGKMTDDQLLAYIQLWITTTTTPPQP